MGTTAQQTPSPLSFETLGNASEEPEPRLGRLSLQDRGPIRTPHYVALTSRGVVPHLAQDMMQDYTNIRGIYTSLEDFIENTPSQPSPVYACPAPEEQSRLRRFIALQQNTLLILGSRRQPPITSRIGNSNTSIAIQGALGFSNLEVEDYVKAVQILRPDIALGVADYEFGKRPGVKRLEKMGDRTLAWTQELAAGTIGSGTEASRTALFAPVLPIDIHQQSYYLESVVEELSEKVSGWTLYEPASVFAIPKPLRHLPRLSLAVPKGPQGLLNQVSLGMDLCTIPFIGEATDAGIAFTFSFPAIATDETSSQIPLGLDIWSSSYASDLSPLQQDCQCYSCTNHHRAYIHHLLDAKEMLAWVLLQLHNHHVCDLFFTGIRNAIENKTFRREQSIFERLYESEFPPKTGQGPRLRGYQTKSGTGDQRKNPAAYRTLDNGAEGLAEATLPGAGTDGMSLQRQGFASKMD